MERLNGRKYSITGSDKAIPLTLKTEDNILDEMVIHNISDARQQEIQKALQWALEKTYSAR